MPAHSERRGGRTGAHARVAALRGEAGRTSTASGWIPDSRPAGRRRGRRRAVGEPGAVAELDGVEVSGSVEDRAGVDVPEATRGPEAREEPRAREEPDARGEPGAREEPGVVGSPHAAAVLEDPEAEESAPGAPARGRWAARLLRRGPWGDLAERWVPEQLQQARVDPGRRGTALLAIVAAVAAVLAAAGVWWNRPQSVPVTPALRTASTAAVTQLGVRLGPTTTTDPARRATDAAAGTPSPTTATHRDGPIWVSVTGRVHDPGLVTVPADARVADAITAAGGALDPDDLTGINLAAHLSDGDSVVVAGSGGSTVVAESASTSGSSDAPGPHASVNINTADAAALEELPGVGPVTAAAIVAWRRDHGDFASIDQLQAVSGIGPATFERLSPYITV